MSVGFLRDPSYLFECPSSNRGSSRRRSRKKSVFQSLFFRGHSFVFGGVTLTFKNSVWSWFLMSFNTEFDQKFLCRDNFWAMNLMMEDDFTQKSGYLRNLFHPLLQFGIFCSSCKECHQISTKNADVSDFKLPHKQTGTI